MGTVQVDDLTKGLLLTIKDVREPPDIPDNYQDTYEQMADDMAAMFTNSPNQEDELLDRYRRMFGTPLRVEEVALPFFAASFFWNGVPGRVIVDTRLAVLTRVSPEYAKFLGESHGG